MTRRILFPRIDQGPTGGEVKVRDYFDHCLSYPGLEPYVYLHAASGSSPAWRQLWSGIPSDRIVPEIDLSRYALLFLGGIHWELVPDTAGLTVINLIQHINHGDPRCPRLHGFLKNFAHRICVAPEILAAIAPHAVGPLTLIRNGIPLDRCVPATPKVAGSVLILARKHQEFGVSLRGRLAHRGVAAEALLEWEPRSAFFSRLRATDLFVGLPKPVEGFYLPALEAMACGCAVVCADAVGNRGFCIPFETCLQPQRGDLDGHEAAVMAVLGDGGLRERLRAWGTMMARRHSLDAEREAFHRFLSGLLG